MMEAHRKVKAEEKRGRGIFVMSISGVRPTPAKNRLRWSAR
jgi:hypothetical protein